MFNRTIRKRATGALTILTIGVMSTFAQNTLVLHVDQAQDTIKKTIYGGLMEHWHRDVYDGLYVGTDSKIPNTNGMRNDIIEGLKEMQIGVMQFPGGCMAEEYKWFNGIDGRTDSDNGNIITKQSREQKNRSAWGTRDPEIHGYDTDEYFQLCELVGSAPFIQANCFSGSTAGMKAWLEYINEKFPGKLRYLGIGNEPWGGCRDFFGAGGVKRYLDEWYDPFNAVIPDVFKGKIIRIAASGFTDEKSMNTAWTDEVLRRELGQVKNMEGLSWHYYTTRDFGGANAYTSIGFGESDYYALLTLAYAMEPQAKKVIGMMDKYDPDITCGLQPDEWGAWNKTLPGGFGASFQQMTVREAQITAQHLNFFNNHCKRIWMAQCAQPVNAIHSFFLTHPTTGEMVKTPAFYVYKLYVPHHNALMVPSQLTCSKVNNLNVLTASASVNADDILHISINNIHATASQQVAITIDGAQYDSISGKIVNGPSYNSYNDFGKAEDVNIKDFASSNFSLNGNTATVTLPAHSVVMLELKPPVTGTVNTINSAVAHPFAVSSLPGNRIEVHHGFGKSTPVSMALYTIDGKLAAPVFTTTGTSDNAITWAPEIRNAGCTTYILTVTADGISRSKQVLLQ